MRTWLLTLCLALPLGCGGHDSSAASGSALAAVTSAPADDPLGATPAEQAEEAALAAQVADYLSGELGLDAPRAARVRELVARAWSETRREVARRIENGESLEEEVMSELLEARQQALDLELAALLGPAERQAFAELGGRVEEAP